MQGVKANPDSLIPNSAIDRPHSPTTREALTSECLYMLFATAGL